MLRPQIIGNSEDLKKKCVLYTVYAVKGFFEKREVLMSSLKAAISHINVSVPVKIDEGTFVACINGFCTNEKWKGHI